MTKRLKNRYWSLRVGNLELESYSKPNEPHMLDISFKVTKTTAREPNKAEILIRNLNPRHRNQIDQMATVQVILVAGYRDVHETIFSGDVSEAWSYWEGTEVLTRIAGSDGGNTYRNSRISQTFAPGTRVATVLRAAINSLGIGTGNLSDYESTLRLSSAGDNYPSGTTLHGPAREQVDRIVRSCGLRWSIQNGNFQLRVPGQPTFRTALVLKPTTGLISNPSRDKDGKVSAQTLLIPGALPGRSVFLSTRELSGQYHIKKVEYSGDTSSTDWYCNLELEPYETRES